MADAYRGRFAPSPTGPLHFGSLVAAVGSWLHARRQNGQWLVRMEDIDQPRCVPGADKAILETLIAYGLEWDEDVVWQTQRHPLYAAALDQLEPHTFPCVCTRREVGDRYPGTCRNGLPPGREPRAIRLRVPDDMACGDLVLRRADGLYAYQFVVVVDDAAQHITHVVRGADLLDSTPPQIHLHHLLNNPAPTYIHLPIATNAAGEKLSKQTKAPAIPPHGDLQTLKEALRFLGEEPPQTAANCRDLLIQTIG